MNVKVGDVVYHQYPDNFEQCISLVRGVHDNGIVNLQILWPLDYSDESILTTLMSDSVDLFKPYDFPSLIKLNDQLQQIVSAANTARAAISQVLANAN